jgi:FixJ family two-component response regulator
MMDVGLDKRQYWRSWVLLALGAMGSNMTSRPLVSVVDDDESVRESLPDLLGEMGFTAKAFASAEEFLASGIIKQTRCLVLDITMPGMTGPDLQQELINRGLVVPIVFITARPNEAMFARLIQRGAVRCILKPFKDLELREAIETALSSKPGSTGS